MAEISTEIPYANLIGKKIRRLAINKDDVRQDYTLGSLQVEDWEGNLYRWTHENDDDEDMYVYLTDIIGDMKELQGYNIINIDVYKSDTDTYTLDRIIGDGRILYEKRIPDGANHLTVESKCVFDRDVYTLCCIRIQTINGCVEVWTIGFAYEDCAYAGYKLYEID